MSGLATRAKDFVILLLAGSLFLSLTVKQSPGSLKVFNEPNFHTPPQPPTPCPVFEPIDLPPINPRPTMSPPKFGHPKIQYKGKAFSEVGQDSYFLKVSLPIYQGYFIEFGCANGVEASNTYLFEKAYNWTGLCIEAHPLSYQQAKLARPNSIVLNLGVAKEPGVLEFWYLTSPKGEPVAPTLAGVGKFYSKAFLDLIDDYVKKGNTLNKVNVSVVPLSVLQRQYFEPNSVIDLLSMDCEGCEWEAMQGIDWDYNRFSFVTYELNTASKRYKAEMLAMMTRNNYIIQNDTAATDNPIFLSRDRAGTSAKP